MQEKVFVIEKMIVVGIWELMSSHFYTDERTAIDNCMSIMKHMREHDSNFCARVTTLELYKGQSDNKR